MQPVYLSIQQKATGERIRELLKKNGYTVKDIQKFMGRGYFCVKIKFMENNNCA